MTTVVMNPEQFEQLLVAIIAVGMCICMCLGFNAHKSSD